MTTYRVVLMFEISENDDPPDQWEWEKLLFFPSNIKRQVTVVSSEVMPS